MPQQQHQDPLGVGWHKTCLRILQPVYREITSLANKAGKSRSLIVHELLELGLTATKDGQKDNSSA